MPKFLDFDRSPTEICAPDYYTLQAIMRVVFECGFAYVQFSYFPLKIEPLYKCQGHPCPNVVDCFISRPKEKTLISRILFGVTVMSCSVAFLDLYYLGYKRILKAFERKREQHDVKGKLVTKDELPAFLKVFVNETLRSISNQPRLSKFFQRPFSLAKSPKRRHQ